MRRLASVTAVAALVVAAPSATAEKAWILTPTEDSCATFIAAMNVDDTTKVAAFAGWAIGFLSGVAEGSNVDFLRTPSQQDAVALLYSECGKQPARQMSEVLEEIAAALIANRRRR
jgi:hypothetical protein